MDVESRIAIAGLLGISTGMASIILFIYPQLTTCPPTLLITLFIITIIVIGKFITRLLNKLYNILYEPFELDIFSYRPDNLNIAGLVSLMAGISSLALSYNPDILFSDFLPFAIVATLIGFMFIFSIGTIIILILATIVNLNQIFTTMIVFGYMFSLFFLEDQLFYLMKTDILIPLCTLCAIISGIWVMFVWKVTRKWHKS